MNASSIFFLQALLVIALPYLSWRLSGLQAVLPLVVVHILAGVMLGPSVFGLYAPQASPEMHIVITVCDSAAAEECPYWPGSPVKVHWGYVDPSNAAGGDDGKRQAFELTRQAISYRMLQLLQLPLENLSKADLQEVLTAISKS